MDFKNILKFGNSKAAPARTSEAEINQLLQMAMKHKGNAAIKGALREIAQHDPVNLFVSLFRQQRSLFKKEIGDFMSARAQAINIINSNRYYLLQFYLDVELDPFIFGLVNNKRILKISNKKFRIINRKTRIEDTVKTDLLKKKWFNKLIKFGMQSKFHGYSLVYFSDWKNGEISDCKLVYREHVKPEKNCIIKTPFDIDGVDYTAPPFSDYMIGIGDPDDLGLYEKAGIMYVLKKHSWANWDEFEEIFGIPIRIAKTATTDPKVRAEMEQTLAEMGSAAWGILPQDSEIDIKENSKQDAFKVFNEKRKAANEELEILFTGQKRETATGGTYGKEKAQQAEAVEVIEDDKAFIYHMINDDLLPLLRLNGYPFTDDDEFVYDDTQILSQVDKAAIYDKVNNWGFELDQKDVEEQFNIKLIGKKLDKALPPPLPDPNKIKDIITLHDLIKNSHV